MKREYILCGLLALAMAVVAGSLWPHEPPPAPKPRPHLPTLRYPKVAEELLRAHNKVRESKKLPPLRLNPKLQAASEAHGRWMAEHSKMTHGGDSTMGRRLSNAGYDYQRAGENVAFGQPSAEGVVHAWMTSDPFHRANVLGHWNDLGAFMATSKNGTKYWVCDYGVRGGTGAIGAAGTPKTEVHESEAASGMTLELP